VETHSLSVAKGSRSELRLIQNRVYEAGVDVKTNFE